MRSISGLVCLSLLLALAVGCDTEQPLQAGAQELTLTFTTPGVQASASSQVLIPSLNTWRGFEDNDSDGQPDGAEFLFCTTFTSNPGFPDVNPASVPWAFGLDVSVIRAGTQFPVRVSAGTSQTFDPSLNLAEYDTNQRTTFVFCPSGWTNMGSSCTRTVMDGTTPRTFRLRTPARLLSPFHIDVRSATSNPLTTIDPGTFGLGAGLCSDTFPGPAVIDGGPPPYRLSLNSGDTVIVEARQSPTGPMGLFFNGQVPSLGANVLVNGVTTNVQGTVSTQPSAGIDTLRFTLTVQ